MTILTQLAALVAAATLACAPAAAQMDRSLPLAPTLTGSETMRGIYGSGCATGALPCTSAKITLPQIGTYLASSGTLQLHDADLDAIAALPTLDFGRQLLTKADAASVRSYLGLGSVDNTADVSKSVLSATKLTTVRTLSVTGDTIWSLLFDGSGNATGTSALSTSGVTAGSYTNANITVDAKGRVTSAANGAAGGGGSGTVTSVTGTAPIVSSGGNTPAISISAASTSAAGSMSAADKTKLDAISGTNTGDQTSVSGNAGTATKLATARTIAGSGDTTWSVSFDGSANVTGTTTIANNAVTFGKFVAATQAAIVGATAAGNFAEQTPAAGRSILGVTATGADTTYAFRANNLSDLPNVSTARSNLGLGNAATYNVGVSGSAIPLLSGSNTWGAPQTFTNPSNSTYPQVASFLAANTPTGGVGTGPYMSFGVASTGNNSAVFQFTYQGSGSASNFAALGLYGSAAAVNIFSNGLSIGTSAAAPPANGITVAGNSVLAGGSTMTVPTYASDSAAGSGGLTTGQVYKTSDGSGGFYLKIKS